MKKSIINRQRDKEIMTDLKGWSTRYLLKIMFLKYTERKTISLHLKKKKTLRCGAGEGLPVPRNSWSPSLSHLKPSFLRLVSSLPPLHPGSELPCRALLSGVWPGSLVPIDSSLGAVERHCGRDQGPWRWELVYSDALGILFGIFKGV